MLRSYINPCFLDGIEGTLRENGTNSYLWRRNIAGSSRIVKAGSTIICDMSNTLGNPIAASICVGANGSYADTADLIEQTKKVAHYYKTNYYVVFGNYYVTDTETHTEYKSMLADRIEQEAALLKEFGIHFIDIRKYLISHGIEDAITFGLLPNNGTYPTSADTTAISQGKCPPSLLQADLVHPTVALYELIARLGFSRLKQLGLFNQSY